MTTKKINTGQEVSGLLRSLLANPNKKKQVDGKEVEKNNLSSEGTVNFELSKRIQAELNPELFAAERSEKINKIKELIKSGQYNPKSEDIAAALQQDIVFEILSSPSDAANE